MLFKRFSLIVVLAILLVAMFGCGSDDDGTGPSDGSGLGTYAGTWIYSATVSSGSVDMVDGTTLDLDSGGTWEQTVGTTVTASGTVTLETIEDADVLMMVVEESTTPDLVGDTLVYMADANDYCLTIDYLLDGVHHDILFRDKEGSNGFVGMLYAAAQSMVLPEVELTFTFAEGDPVTLTTDDYGMVSSDELPVGSATVSAEVDGFQTLSTNIEILENQTLFTGFALSATTTGPTGTVTGTVTDAATEAAIAGAEVSSDDGIITTTGSDGTYTMTVGAGARTISVSADGYGNASEEVTVTENVESQVDFELTEAGPPGLVHGSVSADVTAIVGAQVTSDDGESTVTNEFGSYTLMVSAGERTITVTADNYVTDSQTVTVVSNEASQLDFVLEEDGGGTANGTIRCTVTDANTSMAIVGATMATSDGSSATTNNIGEASITLAPGTYTLTVSMAGYAPYSSDVVVVSGELNEIPVSLSPGSAGPTFTVYGYVREDSDFGMILPGVTITSDDGFSTTTTANDNFTLEVGVGSRTLTFTKDLYTTVTVPVSSNTENDHVNLGIVVMVLDESLTTVHGYVYDSSNSQGVGNAYIYSVIDGIGTNASSSGHFEFAVTTSGSHAFLITADGYEDLQETIVLVESESNEHNFFIDPAGGGSNCVISGHVTYVNGIAPLPHAKVSVSSSLYAYTDFEGNYTLSVPFPQDTGYYEVTATHPAFTSTSQNVGLSYEGEEVSQDLNVGANDQVTYIFGTVVDDNGTPLSGVTFDGDGFSGSSHSDGTFEIQPMVFSGNLEAWKDGYQSQTQNFNTSFGHSIRMDFVLPVSR